MPKPYHPPKLPITINASLIINELAEAHFELGELNGLHRNIPEPLLLLAPLTTKEAAVSSKIEGTRSTVRDVMLFEAGAGQKYDDTLEVANYKRAILWAMDALKKRELNLSFIKELHSILLKDTRGHQTRGVFRKDQVIVGKPGDTIETASYVPPEPILVSDYMENLEHYIAANGENPLIKAAVIHYQFEAIHPFRDGNGRIGRLFIPLYLYQRKLLFQPILYLSGYFERNRDQYLDELHRVDATQKLESWVALFLKAVREQAKETQALIRKINNLKDEVMSVVESIRSPYAHRTVDF
jgi:Fic family protein